MAGRGRSATLPAWMTSGGIAETELKAEGQETTIVNLPSIETSTIPTTQNIISNTNIIAPSYSIPSSYNSSTTNPYPTSASTIVIPPHPSFLQPPNSFAINVPKPFQTPIYPGLGHGLQAPTTLGMPGNTPFAYNVPSWNPATQYGLQQLPTQMPTFVPPPRAYPTNPMQPRPISAGPPQLAMDPNNDVKAWSEHSGTDGRVYWFNKLTAVSTYEKPFCLKTPEERAIPPCPWKEYATPEGKKYYSNGTESVWVMPDEFKVWKERVDAAVAKKAAAMSNTTIAGTHVDTMEKVGDASTVSGVEGERNQRRSKQKSAPELEKVVLVFNSREEARAAFIALLSEKNVSSTMRSKDVQELCQDDPRWEALKGGDKKQELAEFQTRKLKEEREQQRLKVKKSKDAFLLMLAECVQIDVRTRWQSAVELLQKDARFKNVEDARDREDLFNDFVKELEKKEREDRLHRRDTALQVLTKIMGNMLDEGRVHRKSVWSEHKAEIINLMVKEPELRVLEESDARRCFNDLLDQADLEFRQQRKAKKVSLQELLDKQLSVFRNHLLDMLRQEVIEIDTNMRWKELAALSPVQNDVAYKEIIEIINGNGDEDMSARVLGLIGDPRDVFLDVQKDIADALKVDKSLIRELIVDKRLDITSETAFTDFKNSLCNIASVKEVVSERSTSSFVAEEGEEIEDIDAVRYSVSRPSQLRQLLVARPHMLERIFKAVRDEILQEQSEHLKRMQRREEKYNSLLSEVFYRSDHVGVSWEDAKLKLEDSKEYYDLPRDDRKRLFLSHMSELSRRLDSKKESMRHLEQESSSTEPSKSSGVTVDSSLKVAKEDAIKEESERHSDRSSSSSSDEEIEKKSKHTKKDKKDKKRKKEDDKSTKHKKSKSSS